MTVQVKQDYECFGGVRVCKDQPYHAEYVQDNPSRVMIQVSPLIQVMAEVKNIDIIGVK